MSHQVSVDVLLGLQVGHAFRDVLTHLQQLDHSRVLLQSFSEVRQQAAVGQKLSHDVNWSLCGAHAVQLDQVFMMELPGLSQSRRKGVSRDTSQHDTEKCTDTTLTLYLYQAVQDKSCLFTIFHI